MEELTEERKQKIANSLSKLSERLDEIKPLCTNEPQKKIVRAIEGFLGSFRVEDGEE